MPARPRRSSSFQSLDSLLDMMANVVGVLVVVVAVTQLSVGSAMRRITAAVSEQADSLLEQRADAEARWQALEPDAPQAREELAEFEAQLRALRTTPAALSVDVENASALEAALSRDQERLQALRAEVGGARGELAALRASLPGSGAPGELQSRIVRLPDPRPAPPGAEPIRLMCRHERVFFAHFDRLVEELYSGVARATGNPRGITARNAPLIASYFNQNDVGTELLRLKMSHLGPQLLIVSLAWRQPDVGETILEIQDPGSNYRRTLAGLDENRHYLRYQVWNDSFDVYLEARRIAEGAGFAAGWQAFDRNQEYESNLLVRSFMDAIPVD